MTPYEMMERSIDKYGVADTLLMVGDICAAKAEHIFGNWQDERLSDRWLKAERVVRNAVKELPKVPGIK